jgi:hypothetical protein
MIEGSARSPRRLGTRNQCAQACVRRPNELGERTSLSAPAAFTAATVRGGGTYNVSRARGYQKWGGGRKLASVLVGEAVAARPRTGVGLPLSTWRSCVVAASVRLPARTLLALVGCTIAIFLQIADVRTVRSGTRSPLSRLWRSTQSPLRDGRSGTGRGSAIRRRTSEFFGVIRPVAEA